MQIQQLNGQVWTGTNSNHFFRQSVVIQTISVDAVLAEVARRRAEWLSDGLDLARVQIPVADMFEEICSIFRDLGIIDAFERVGIESSDNDIIEARHA